MGIKQAAIRLNKNSIAVSIKKSTKKIDQRLSSLKVPFFLKKSKFLLPIIAVIILIVVILSYSSSDESGIPVFKVNKANFLISITESGELRAKNSITIPAPRVRGNLKVVYLIPEGTYVKAGDIVVKFDPIEAVTSLKTAEANLQVALSERQKLIANQNSAKAQADADFKTAELTFELSKLNLEQIKFEAQIKQQEAQLQYKRDELSYLRAKQDAESKEIIRKAELNKMDIEIQQKRSELEKAKLDLEMLTLAAPSEGLAVYEPNWGNNGRKFSIGDQAWGGMSIISLPDLSAMESNAYINEVDISKIKVGQKVNITLDAFRDSSFDGVIENVARLGKSKDNNPNIKVFEINVLINSVSEILKPGMTTSNKVTINQVLNVLFVPQESVFEKEGKKIVFIKNGSGFDEQEIEVGEKNEDFIIVTKGLKAGNEVALRDPTIQIDNKETTGNKNSSVEYPSSVK